MQRPSWNKVGPGPCFVGRLFLCLHRVVYRNFLLKVASARSSRNILPEEHLISVHIGCMQEVNLFEMLL